MSRIIIPRFLSSRALDRALKLSLSTQLQQTQIHRSAAASPSRAQGAIKSARLSTSTGPAAHANHIAESLASRGYRGEKMAPNREDPVLLTRLPDAPRASFVQALPPVPKGCSRLYLCRHGQTDYNRMNKFQGRGVNTELNEVGILQASYLAHAMREVPLRAIYSSSLDRAKQTAQIVAQFHPKLSLEKFTELEEMSFGDLEGFHHSEYESQLHEIHHAWELGRYDVRFPDGECPLEVARRGAKKIEELMRFATDQDHVLMVTHGRFNKVVLAQLLDGGLDSMQSLTQDNTCVNVVDYDHAKSRFNRVVLNSTQHLPSL